MVMGVENECLLPERVILNLEPLEEVHCFKGTVEP